MIRHGVANLSEIQTGQNISIEKYFQHEKYIDESAYFDIAVLQIAPVEFSSQLQPICLPDPMKFKIDQYDDKTSNVIGWGSQDLHGNTSPTLRRAVLSIYDYR